jgi:5'-nucleotidase
LNTLFNIPEACVFAHLIRFFEGRRDATSVPSSGPEEEEDTFVPRGQDVIRTEAMDIYFKNLWADIRESTDWCHLYTFKSTVVADMQKCTLRVTLRKPFRYSVTIPSIRADLVKTPKLAEFLDTLRKNNRKTFLLTNSPWGYTNSVMSFLLDDEKPSEYKSWLDYFDYIIVDAAKPYFFAQGNTLREVDVQTGRLKISRVEGGGAKVYSGGSIAKFEKLANITNGSGVLYVGDHIFSDVRISKKKHGWRTFLVVPELEKELATWLDPETQKYHRELVTLHRVKAAIYRDFTAESTNPPDLKRIRKSIHQSALCKDDKFNAFFGSLFGSGLQSSFFAMQVQVRRRSY